MSAVGVAGPGRQWTWVKLDKREWRKTKKLRAVPERYPGIAWTHKRDARFNGIVEVLDENDVPVGSVVVDADGSTHVVMSGDLADRKSVSMVLAEACAMIADGQITVPDGSDETQKSAEWWSKRAQKYRLCARYIDWDIQEQDGTVVDKRVKKMRTCSDGVFCPVCAGKRATNWRRWLRQVFREMLKRTVPLMLTLTVPNVQGPELRATIDQMMDAMNVMLNRHANRRLMGHCEGYTRFFECPWNEDTGFHPHAHVILFMRRGYWMGSDSYIDEPTERYILQTWQRLMGDASIENIKIQRIKGKNGSIAPLAVEAALIRETVKYCTLQTDYIMRDPQGRVDVERTASILYWLMPALHGRRLISLGMRCKDLKKEIVDREEAEKAAKKQEEEVEEKAGTSPWNATARTVYDQRIGGYIWGCGRRRDGSVVRITGEGKRKDNIEDVQSRYKVNTQDIQNAPLTGIQISLDDLRGSPIAERCAPQPKTHRKRRRRRLRGCTWQQMTLDALMNPPTAPRQLTLDLDDDDIGAPLVGKQLSLDDLDARRRVRSRSRRRRQRAQDAGEVRQMTLGELTHPLLSVSPAIVRLLTSPMDAQMQRYINGSDPWFFPRVFPLS